MKTKLTSFLLIASGLFAACNNGSKNEHTGHEAAKDTAHHATTTDDKEIKSVAVTFSNVDPKLALSLKEVLDHYVHIKNGLGNDNSNEAASGAKAMENKLKSIDKSLFTADQKKIYDEDEADLKEHAEHIGSNGDNIKHQREHFSKLSEVMYDIVKSFGGGQAIYHDHCPMYNKASGGAMWLSETKEIKNPYYGSEMPKCGTVEEIIK